MGLNELMSIIDGMFDVNMGLYKEEAGLTFVGKRSVNVIGYATNLSPQVIKLAHEHGVDLIITHYQAWAFIEGYHERCMGMLKSYNISHYYNHLPLDDAQFGTNMSLASQLGLKVVEQNCLDYGMFCGLVARTDTSFRDLCDLVEDRLGEKILSWQFNDQPVKRVQIVCGGGQRISDIDHGRRAACDTYITGEKNMYLIQYAQFHQMNLIVASHTYTEVFGIKALAEKIRDKTGLSIIQLVEDHFEAMGIGG